MSREREGPSGRPTDEHDLGLVLGRRLITSAEGLRRRHPARAPARARAARDFVATVEPAEDPVAWLHLQAEAWATLGSTYRGVGELARAERALAIAAALLAQVPEDERDRRARARLLQRAAYLRSDQGRAAEALVLNAETVSGFEHVGDRQAAATALVDRALFVHRAGRSRAAIRLVERALEILDPSLAPRAFRAALHNLAIYRLAIADDAATVEAACEHVDRALAAHAAPGVPTIDRIRLWAAVALAATRLGPRDEAIEALRRIQDAIDGAGSPPTRTLLMLHRLAAAVEDGCRGEASRLAGRLYPLLRRLDLPPQLRTEMVHGLAAAQGRTITVDRIREIAEQMARLAGERPESPT